MGLLGVVGSGVHYLIILSLKQVEGAVKSSDYY